MTITQRIIFKILLLSMKINGMNIMINREKPQKSLIY